MSINRRIPLLLFLAVFCICFISPAQEKLDSFKVNDCIQLIQTCDDCSYNNVSSILNPKGDIIPINMQMTKSGTFYNITYCNTSEIGIYQVNGFGDEGGTQGAWNYYLEITGTGYKFDNPKALLYIGLLSILIFLFVVDLVAIPMLPSKDNYDDEGTLLSINQMKYIRPILWVVAWFLLMAVIFTGSNVALAYMGETLIGDILFKIFQIQLALSLPGLVLWFLFIFYNIFQDKEMKKYIERGWEA